MDVDYPIAQLPSKITVSTPTRATFRRGAIWNSLTAGSEGLEVYYGYQSGCGDIDCQDHRTRAALWGDATKALTFFEKHIGNHALSMMADDELTPEDTTDFVFAEPGRRYVVFTTSAQPLKLVMVAQTGRYRINWYDALVGGELRTGSVQRLPWRRTSSPRTLPLVVSTSAARQRWIFGVGRTRRARRLMRVRGSRVCVAPDALSLV